jgi:DNA anti-recombination protein RmuC
MDWVSSLAAICLITVLAVAAILAVVVHDLRRHIRRGVTDTSSRHGEMLRRLADGIATLQRDQREAQTQIEALSRANVRLSQKLAELAGRINDGDTSPRSPGGDRVLH